MELIFFGKDSCDLYIRQEALIPVDENFEEPQEDLGKNCHLLVSYCKTDTSDSLPTNCAIFSYIRKYGHWNNFYKRIKQTKKPGYF